MSSNIEIKKKCKWCGQIFIARKTSTNYCSHKCNNAAYKERIRQERIAAYQKEFIVSTEEAPIEDKEFYTPPEAAKLLGEIETRPRHYYAGFSGPIGLKAGTHLYVTLRCLSMEGKEVTLYAGAGLLEDSDFQNKWEETRHKMQTMLSLLQ